MDRLLSALLVLVQEEENQIAVGIPLPEGTPERSRWSGESSRQAGRLLPKRLSLLLMELVVASEVRLRYLEYKCQLRSAEEKLSQVICSVQQLLKVRTGQRGTCALGKGRGNGEAEGGRGVWCRIRGRTKP